MTKKKNVNRADDQWLIHSDTLWAWFGIVQVIVAGIVVVIGAGFCIGGIVLMVAEPSLSVLCLALGSFFMAAFAAYWCKAALAMFWDETHSAVFVIYPKTIVYLILGVGLMVARMIWTY